jgi:predicted permease
LLLSLAHESSGKQIANPNEFATRLLERVRAIPGVRAASAVDPVPLWFGGKFASFETDGGAVPRATLGHTHVAPGYFDTLQIPIRRGRDFDAHDRAGAPAVAIVNETLARRFWPNQDPIGQRLRNKGVWLEVIGVVRDSKYQTLGEATLPWLYISAAQNTTSSRLRLTLVTRTTGDVTSVIPALTREVRALDPAWPIFDFKTLRESVSVQYFLPHAIATLLGIVGGFGLVLAAIGLYGLISYTVTQRTAEFGIRMALGATRAHVARLVLKHGAGFTLIGVAVGAVLAFGVTRFLKSVLIGVSPVDPATFGTLAVVLLLVALIAGYLPARRATTVDPVTALRAE